MKIVNRIMTHARLLFLVIFICLSSFVDKAQAQSTGKAFVAKRYKGTFSGKKIGVSGGKKKKYKKMRKPANAGQYKKRRGQKINKNVKRNHSKVNKTIRKRNMREYKKRSRNVKSLKRSKSLYSFGGSKKRSKRGGVGKQRKGRYPRSKADLVHKVTFLGMVGVSLTPPAEQLDESGQPENIFSNYRPGPTPGIGIDYNYNANFSLGGEAHFIPLGKELYKIRAFQLGATLKYRFGTQHSVLRPYVFAGLDYSFSNINRDGFEESFNPEPDYSVQDPSNILVTEILYREPSVALKLIPMMGYRIGIGTTYKLKSNMDLFGQIEYNHSFARNKSKILEHFPSNKADFSFLSVTFGVKLNLMKTKSLY